VGSALARSKEGQSTASYLLLSWNLTGRASGLFVFISCNNCLPFSNNLMQSLLGKQQVLKNFVLAPIFLKAKIEGERKDIPNITSTLLFIYFSSTDNDILKHLFPLIQSQMYIMVIKKIPKKE
jgi:hypothetical protein